MTEAVNLKRTYNSPRRREQAAATRREILEAARRLFETQGYAATTVAAIAKEAGVALKTVYLAFETKSGILRALWNLTLRGDEDVPVAEQEWYRETLAEPDPERQLRLNARNSRRGKERVAAVGEMIRSGAAAGEPDLVELWARIQAQYHENQRAIAESLAEKKALAVDVDTAADLLWLVNHPNTWQLLVCERGWSADRYEQWAGDTACAQLLGHRAGSA